MYESKYDPGFLNLSKKTNKNANDITDLFKRVENIEKDNIILQQQKKEDQFRYNNLKEEIGEINNDLFILKQHQKLDKYKEYKNNNFSNNSQPQGGRRKSGRKKRRRKSPRKKRKRKSPGKKRKSPRKRKSPGNSPPQPKVGDHIIIIIKPYANNVKVKGIVKRVLTKRKYHSRGHKVELKDGTIGRTVEILKKK